MTTTIQTEWKTFSELNHTEREAFMAWMQDQRLDHHIIRMTDPDMTCGDFFDQLVRQWQDTLPVTKLKRQAPRAGRPTKITDELRNEIRRLHRDPNLSVRKICKKLHISRSTYYKAIR